MKIVILAVLVACAFAQKGQRLFEFTPKSEDDVRMLLERIEPTYNAIFWSHPEVGTPMMISVDAADVDGFQRTLPSDKLTMVIADISNLFDGAHDRLEQNTIFKAGDDPKDITLNQYHNHQEINNFLDATHARFPAITEVFSIGSSHEGRDMKVIKIGTQTPNKKAVYIDAGIHAREWIAPAVAVYFIHHITHNFGSNARVTDLLTAVNVYVLPSANPDGYEYSRTRGNRLWRGTRSGPRNGCYGADPNRNFPYMYGGEGTSSSPCSQIYRGPNALSEVEVQNNVNFISSRLGEIHAYLATHCYGQYWLIPFGYRTRPSPRPDDYNELLALGNRAADALRAVHGTTFRVGNSGDLLGAAAGAADDWAKSVGVKYAYTPELRPRSGTFNGFELDERFIVPTGEEMTAAYLEVLETVKNESK